MVRTFITDAGEREGVTVVPTWLANSLAMALLLILLSRVAANLGDLDAIPTRERHLTTAVGATLIVIFYLQWKGFIPPLAPPMALVAPGILLFLYPEPKGPVG